MDIWGGGRWAIAKLDYFLDLFLNILGLFLKVRVHHWNIWGLLTFNYFGGMPDTSDSFGGRQ